MYSYNSYHKIIAVAAIVIWAIIHFSGNNEDQLYYSNGQIKRTGQIVNNLNTGKWIWYFSNGAKSIEGSFVEGKREGIWKRYDSLENIITESYYENNKLEGKFTFYRPDGSIQEQYEYRSDTILKRLDK